MLCRKIAVAGQIWPAMPTLLLSSLRAVGVSWVLLSGVRGTRAFLLEYGILECCQPCPTVGV